MRAVQVILWIIAILLFFWVVLNFLAPMNAGAKDILDIVNEFIYALQRFGLRIVRIFWAP